MAHAGKWPLSAEEIVTGKLGLLCLDSPISGALASLGRCIFSLIPVSRALFYVSASLTASDRELIKRSLAPSQTARTGRVCKCCLNATAG